MSANRVRRRRWQRGQAIVLIALVMVVMIGILGLAVDSGRAYLERRQLQNATDSAALAAGDAQENYADLTGKSLPAAIALYEANERLTTAPTTTTTNGTVTAPNGNTYNQTTQVSTWSGHTLTVKATNTQFNGYTFDVIASHPYQVAFMGIFGIVGAIPISAEATSIVGNQRQQPALLTLSTAGCGGTNAPLTMTGAGTLTILGDVYSNGCANADPNLIIAGNSYGGAGSTLSGANYYCYNAAPGFVPYRPNPSCNIGDTVGTYQVPSPPLPDPGYQSGSIPTANQTAISHGSWYEMTPGLWTSMSITDANCYFLDPGVYAGDFANHGSGIISNELKPPDEPSYLDPNAALPAGSEFWNIKKSSGTCAGDFSVQAVARGAGTHPSAGNYGVELTSVRAETGGAPACTAGTPCVRESAPSVCRPVALTGSQAIEVDLNYNSPGAQSYNVYVNPNGCEVPPNPLFSFGPGTSLAANTQVSSIPIAAAGQARTAGQVLYLNSGNGQSVTLAANVNVGDTAIAVVPFTTSSAYPSGTGLRPAVNFLTQTRFGWAANCAAPNGATSSGFSPPAVLCTIDSSNFGGVSSIANAVIGHTTPCAAKTTNTASAGYCQPPDSESSPFCFAVCTATVGQENPPRRLDPGAGDGGDLANENACSSKGTDPNAPCSAATTTPGAVQLYMSGTQCLDQNANAGTYVFSGYQYDWIVIYMPATDTCSPTLNGSSNTAFIGTIYAPGSNAKINGAERSPVSGQVIVATASVAGGATAGIDFNPLYAPAPPAARLVY